MAKDLPYFKFIVSEWNDGAITDCSMEAQGLFINVCSLYWSQSGELTMTRAKKRFRVGNGAWEELMKAGIFRLSGDAIVIKFLDEQIIERKKLSEKNSENIRKRWNNTTVSESNTESNNGGIVLEYNIEEKRREEKREREITQEVATILKYTSPNTSALTYMVRQWMAEVPDIPERLKAMKAYYARQGLVFPTRINTLTESFPQANWIEKLQELDPERAAENFQKTLKDAKHQQQPDLIGSSKPGSLG
jgi:hypothetical protein